MMSTTHTNHWLAHRPRRGPHPVDTVVLHASDAPGAESLIQSLRDHGHSYHYIIDGAGTLYRTVPYCSVAHHAGNSYGPHEAARGIGRVQDARHHFVEMTCVNEYTVSVCLLRDMGGFTKDQLATCRTLLQDLRAPLPKLAYLTTHAHVSPGQVEPIPDLDLPKLASEVQLTPWIG